MEIRTFFTLSILMLVMNLGAQSLQDIRHNELKLNALYLAEGTVEMSYERWVGKRLGIGLSSYVAFRDDGMIFFGDSFPWNFSLIPYMRVYFGKTGYKGFFLEGNFMLGSNTRVRDEKGSGNAIAWDLGAGMAYGAKWVFGKHWGIEAYVGIGLTTNLYDTPQLENLWTWISDEFFYPRCGVSIVKRF